MWEATVAVLQKQMQAQPTGEVFAEEFAVGMAIPEVFKEHMSSVPENDKLGESVDSSGSRGKVSSGEGSALRPEAANQRASVWEDCER